MLPARDCWSDGARTVLLEARDHNGDMLVRWSDVRVGFGSKILPVAGIVFWLRVLCESVALPGGPTTGCAEVPLEYIETPSMEVMMVAGAGPWRYVSD